MALLREQASRRTLPRRGVSRWASLSGS